MNPRLRRVLHWLFFAGASLATLVVFFYAEEDWRGARAWTAVKRDLQARGETLDFNDLIPPPVPDDQNLAMAPFFTRLFQYKVDPRTHVLTFNTGSQSFYQSATYKLFNEMPFGERKPASHPPEKIAPNTGILTDWLGGHFFDLVAAQNYFQQRPDFPHTPQPQLPADAVLMALTRYAPLLDELALASAERPLTRFPVNWPLRPAWDISLPHYNVIQILTTTLRLRAVAELAAGQAPEARRDLAQMFRLRQTMENDPSVIASLVDNNCITILMQAVWEGLAARRWSADDLDALSESLKPINVLKAYQLAIRGERAIMPARWPEDLQNMAEARQWTEILPSFSGEEIGSSARSLDRLLWETLPNWPRGWYEQNAAVASLYFQNYWIDTVDPASHRLTLALNKDHDLLLKNLPLTPGTILARNPMLAKTELSVFSNVVKKAAQTQTFVDQAVIACALEKYYLDHHAYPSTLKELAPAYLAQIPNDVIDGAPMRYRLSADGRYKLYSIGWNGKDDDGAIAWPPDRKWRRTATNSPAQQQQRFPVPDRDEGDWVWQYAPVEPPDPPDNLSRLEALP